MNRFPLVKMLALVGILLVLLMPSAPLLAQDPVQSDDPCDPNATLNEFLERFSEIQDLDQLVEQLAWAGERVMLCWDTWLNLLIEQLMGAQSFMPPLEPAPFEGSLSPDDGVLTPAEAEFVIQIAFSGDLETANQYLCADAQLTPEDMLDDVFLESVSCVQTTDDIMTCTVTVTSTTLGTQTDSIDFQIVGGKLCEEVED